MLPSSVAGSGDARPRRYWLWPIRTTPWLADRMFNLAGLASPFLVSWRWCLTALAIGVGPLGLAGLLGFPLQHLMAALLLAPILLACARNDRFDTFLGVVVVAGMVQSASVILLSAHDSAWTLVLFPESSVYWEKTHHWVMTGENSDYDPAYWGPLHAVQLAGLLASGYVSFGVVPLYNGLVQLDVMNSYVGRLAAMSDNPVTAIAAGWHPWSFLRVVGYTLLLYEVTSYSLERFTGRTLSTRRRRLARWAIGLAFCVADGVVKYLAADSVRQILYDNLSP